MNDPCTSSAKHRAKPKRRYPTRDLAWIAVAAGILHDRARNQRRRWCQPYLCPGCGWWHLTTARYRAKEKARQQVARVHAGSRPWA